MGHDENELEQREEEDVEKLEEDVNEMAQKILHYRTTLPDQLKSALASSLVAQRPAFPTHLSHGSEPGPSGCTNPVLSRHQCRTEMVVNGKSLNSRSGRSGTALCVAALELQDLGILVPLILLEAWQCDFPQGIHVFEALIGSQGTDLFGVLTDAEGPIELGRRSPLAQEDHDTAEKTRLLKQKISSNASALPVLLKRMKECISRIESREPCNEFIPPVFKRKKTS
ncbi:hypothetical protein RHSIM_Rhsim07G0016100 [Rhododendron simsii]|uniref:Uncharacterized protein n=1 Tax=Rhododendron simsii TaxID=118357 RepID=A0A834GSL8_RHOSS|nr:hypothetical protein RHSIM_Rhsim07G0016100 [Rhododendron simsii]